MENPVKIKKFIDRVPGGLMLVPMVLGACVHTFAPDSGKYFGSFTNGLISGTVPILAVWFFCMGATIDLRATGVVLRKSGTLVLTKTLVAWLVTLICARFIPGDGCSGSDYLDTDLRSAIRPRTSRGWPDGLREVI
ncbi:MAG: 2-keto-3-deoxygluconate permease [Burkholderia gladioli]|nr:MAG: 2-keto-3-deoxygluconate permease [Burkholderia gladioli]